MDQRNSDVVLHMEQGGPSQNPVNTEYLPLFKAVRNGRLEDTVEFVDRNPGALKAKITALGQTALHVATYFEHLHIVEKLVELMSKDDLLLMDNHQFTALNCACVNPTKKTVYAAKCMVEKNEELVTVPSVENKIPITLALEFDHIEMARYLYPLTREALLSEKGGPGAVFLNQCVNCKIFDIALDLIKLCPSLLVTTSEELNFWVTLAAVPSACHSGIQLPYWKRWLHNWVRWHQEPACNIPRTSEITGDHYVCCPCCVCSTCCGVHWHQEPASNIPRTSEGTGDHCACSPRCVCSTCCGLLHQLVRNTLNFSGIMKIDEANLARKQYLELLHVAYNLIPSPYEGTILRNKIRAGLIVAVQRGNPEFIVEAVKIDSSLLWTNDMEGMPLFHLAVRFRQAKVFNLIHGLVLKQVVNFTDRNDNTLLHMVGELPPPARLNHISGALLQMQRELQWFKEVESTMPPSKKDYVNKAGLTARELFTQNHKNLVKEGEQWTKGTASSCSVIAALVVTITFAAAFTVPGGNDQTTGYPIFLHKKLFMLFIISNAASLLTSSTSLLIFLELLTYHYKEDEFLKAIPTKLIRGISAMFISIATMIIAFCAALFLMLQNQYSWIYFPVTGLACAPIAFWALLQRRLLIAIFMSTYGLGIFNRNVEPWP